MLVPFLLYLCAYVAWAYMQSSEQQRDKQLARVLSVPIWFFGLVFFAQFFGPLRVPILLASAIVIALIATSVISASKLTGEPLLLMLWSHLVHEVIPIFKLK